MLFSALILLKMDNSTLTIIPIPGLEFPEKFGGLYGSFCNILVVFMATQRWSYAWVKSRTENLNFSDYVTCVATLLCAFFNFVASNLVPASVSSTLFCRWGILLCIIFYTSTKCTIYLLFMEKAFQAHRGFFRGSRLEHRLYRINLFLFSLYGILITLMMVYRVNEIVDPGIRGICYIGIGMEAAIPLFVYDTLFSIYLTVLFLSPFLRGSNTTLQGKSSGKGEKMRDMIFRSLVGSMLTLVSSGINVLILTVFSKLRLVICLSLCTTDIAINCAVIHYMVRMKPLRVSARTDYFTQSAHMAAGTETGITRKITPQILTDLTNV